MLTDVSTEIGGALFYIIAAIGYMLVMYIIYKIEAKNALKEKPDEFTSLQLLARKWNCSEYDVFHRSKEDWNISDGRAEKNFNEYMTDGVLPYYVRDFLRRNQKEIEQYRANLGKRENHLPFWLRW